MHVEAEAAEYAPAWHARHADAAEAPTSAEYVPLVQSVHVEDPAAQARTPQGLRESDTM